MSALIPVKKMDKNGKLVTRHVKADKVGNSAEWLKALTPKPVANERERIIRDCGDFLRDGENEIALSTLSDSELADLSLIIGRTELDSDFSTLRQLFNPTQHAPFNDPMMWGDLQYDLEAIALYGEAVEGMPLSQRLPLIRGIYVYEYRSVPRKAHQSLMKTSIAAMEVLREIEDGFIAPSLVKQPMPDNLDNRWSFFEEDDHSVKVWIRNQRFISLVLRRVEDTDEIIRVMHERKTLQPELIEAILDTESHQSLKDGAL